MNFNLLLDELKDVPVRTVLYHGTNIEYFLSILDDGYLKGSFFDTKSTSNNYSELATSRKAGITSIENLKNEQLKEKKKKELSYNIGFVRFNLFKDRIVSSLRGVTTKPIAEIPKGILENMKSNLKFFSDKFVGRKTIDIVRELLDSYRNFNKKNSEPEPAIDFSTHLQKKYAYRTTDFSDYLQKKYNQEDKVKIYNLVYDLKTLNDYLINREFEERFVFKGKNKSIPLKKEYMEIEFLPGIVNEIREFLRDMLEIFIDNYKGDEDDSGLIKIVEKQKKILAQNMLTKFQKNSTLFKQNKAYQDVIRYLENKST